MGGDSDNNDRNLQPTNDDKEESCSDLMKKPLCLSSINADKTRPNPEDVSRLGEVRHHKSVITRDSEHRKWETSGYRIEGFTVGELLLVAAVTHGFFFFLFLIPGKIEKEKKKKHRSSVPHSYHPPAYSGQRFE